MTQHSQQQTVISSQRQYTERRDLACPYDSKSKRTNTQCISAWPWGISKKKISQNFPHHHCSSPLLFPSSLPCFSSFCPLTPTAAVGTKRFIPNSPSSRPSIPPFRLSVHPSSPFGQTGNFDSTFRRRGMTLGSMCATVIRTNGPIHRLLPWTERRRLSKLGQTMTPRLPGIHPNRALSLQKKIQTEANVQCRWAVMGSHSPPCLLKCGRLMHPSPF